MNWYITAKTEQIRREALDWEGMKNGFLGGAAIGTIPAAIMIWMSTTGATQQQAQQYIGQDEAKARQVIESAPPQAIQELQQSPQDPFASQTSKAPQPQDQLESTSPSSVRQNPFGHFVAQWEGAENRVYTDTTGNRTIGVGFNLERADARQMLTSVGADYDAVISGQQILDEQQIQGLLSHTVDEAEKGARSIFSNFDQHPFEIQQILVDLVFNMGYPTMSSSFPKFRRAVANGDYKNAAAELVDSKWFNQVGRRSRHHVSIFERFAR